VVPTPLKVTPGIDATRPCVAVMGATATGKSRLGIALAACFRGEIVSMDSRQVYRGMNIGTGKVGVVERSVVVHHLIDIMDPGETGNAGRHAELTHRAIEEIHGCGRVPFLVGGTGLYFDAVFRPLVDVDIPPGRLRAIRNGFEGWETNELHRELERIDPARASELSQNDRVRITRALEIHAATGRRPSELYATPIEGVRYRWLKLVLTLPRPLLRRRIAERTRAMFEAGWPDEVRRLIEAGYGPDSPGMRSLGYGEIAGAILAGDPPESALERVVTLTHQYAKRQETYFRKLKEAVWLDASRDDLEEHATRLVEDFLEIEA